MKRFEYILCEKIGLDATVIGLGAIGRAVRLQMKALGLKHPADYEQALTNSVRERLALVEALVVSETWFFREPEAFAALARLVAGVESPRAAAEPVRVLCLPCSSGEEPFSAAIALLEAKVSPDRFRIEGVDISHEALNRARRGCYGKNSFRGDVLRFRARYFQARAEGFALCDEIRKCVQFNQGDLLNPEWAGNRGPYDFVFCRNLLIYFAPATRNNALSTLARLLAPRGVLFLGPAEQTLAVQAGFRPVGMPLTFACRKPAEVAAAKRAPRPEPAVQEALSLTAPAGLEGAWKLASSGHLAEAAMVCEAHLRDNRPAAVVYYLLGLLREALGDHRAGDCYRRALYLEPGHYESLKQMAWLARRRGDLESAKLFEQRAKRRLALRS